MNDFKIGIDADINGFKILKIEASKDEKGYSLDLDVAGLSIDDIAKMVAGAFIDATEKLK